MSDTETLNSYLAAWGLSNPQLLRQTATSHHPGAQGCHRALARVEELRVLSCT